MSAQNSDGGHFFQSVIGQKLNNRTLNVPEPAPLIEDGEPLPYVIVGDEVFPLKIICFDHIADTI